MNRWSSDSLKDYNQGYHYQGRHSQSRHNQRHYSDSHHNQSRHCERSEAIHGRIDTVHGLLRYARNDDFGYDSASFITCYDRSTHFFYPE